MDLVDRIHRSSFLGPEFLTWLWCRSEEFEGRFRLESEKDPFELWFDDRLTVGSTLVDAQENLFRGGHPTSSPEAHMALRQGKMATEARLRVVRGAQEWSFVIKAKDLSLSALKVPVVLTKEEDERFYERMYLLEQLDNIIRALYQLFLTERMGSDWHTQHLPHMQAWINAQGEYGKVENRPSRAEDPISPPKSTPQAKAFEDELSADLTPLNPGGETSLNESNVPPWENPIMGEDD